MQEVTFQPVQKKGFKELNNKRIACLTYHKYPGTDWPEGDFKEHQVKLVHGNVETMKLAEKSLTMSNGFVVREIRLLETNGHQPPIIVTNHKLTIEQSAATMFARWSQENFLKYMREHYALDRLISYEKEKLDETTRVVNPAWRKLEHAVRSLAAKVNLKLRRFGAMSLPNTIEPEQMESALQKKESLQKEIQQLGQELEETKKRRADVPHHVKLGELPQNERFDRLSSGSKDLVDTIKLIAYRAQTAMSQIVRESLPKWRSQESRRLLQSLYSCEADLVPDTTANTLTVRIHYPANPMLGQAAQKLCDELSASETVFPTTKLRLIYKLVSAENPRGQEV